ncbi:MAG: Cytidylate kinase [Methanonatronarchaeales archaeon]|nr:Cytidylate kinase [Methanonatronarchaeales archaeon]
MKSRDDGEAPTDRPRLIVTVSGLAGSGTSTTAEVISSNLEIDVLSVGETFRREAERRGMSLEEFGEYASKDPEVDRRIDERQAEIASDADNLVVEGRLAGWMVDADLKVWLKAPLEVRAKRVAARENQTVREAEGDIRRREECERERYGEFYGIDISDLSAYHLVIDTSRWEPGGVASLVETGINLI